MSPSSSVMGGIALIVMLLMLLLPLVGLIVGILLWTLSGRKSEGMTCGQCGYNVQGLSQLNCPECGADLRAAGIIPGRKSGAGRIIGMVLTFLSIAILLLFCGLSGFMLMRYQQSSPASQPLHLQTVPTQPTPTSP